mmetsp:Transcript_30198/g.69156  ORF Transcript_30198/g.69156 Transcript_30198/m.69156 type:complete len:206 (+) Transcript_30198:22-639(+)
MLRRDATVRVGIAAHHPEAGDTREPVEGERSTEPRSRRKANHRPHVDRLHRPLRRERPCKQRGGGHVLLSHVLRGLRSRPGERPRSLLLLLLLLLLLRRQRPCAYLGRRSAAAVHRTVASVPPGVSAALATALAELAPSLAQQRRGGLSHRSQLEAERTRLRRCVIAGQLRLSRARHQPPSLLLRSRARKPQQCDFGLGLRARQL